jgi:hypothetical protein
MLIEDLFFVLAMIGIAVMLSVFAWILIDKSKSKKQQLSPI